MGGSEGGGVFQISCVTWSVPGSLFRVGPSFLAATFGRGCFMWTCCSHLFAGWSAFSLYLLVCHSLLHNYRDGVQRDTLLRNALLKIVFPPCLMVYEEIFLHCLIVYEPEKMLHIPGGRLKIWITPLRVPARSPSLGSQQ